MAGSRDAGPRVATILVRTLPSGSKFEFVMDTIANPQFPAPAVPPLGDTSPGRIILIDFPDDRVGKAHGECRDLTGREVAGSRSSACPLEALLCAARFSMISLCPRRGGNLSRSGKMIRFGVSRDR